MNRRNRRMFRRNLPLVRPNGRRPNANVNRLSNYATRRRVANRIQYRRANNMNTLPSNNNVVSTNNNSRRVREKIRNINDKLSTITEEMSKMTLKNNTVSNRYKSKKEMRKDMLISAMNMFKYSMKYGFYKCSLKLVKFDHYFKYAHNHGNTREQLIWFPYAYPAPPTGTVNYNSGTAQVDEIAPLVIRDASTGTYAGIGAAPTTLKGENRLIAATLRIMNFSPATTRQGTYTIYRLHESGIVPMAGNSGYSMAPNRIPQVYKDQANPILNGPLDTVSSKLTFGSSEVGYIDEYNVHEGTSMFCSTNEYLGMQYLNYQGGSAIVYPSADGDIKSNPVGLNVTYVIDMPAVTTSQNYLIEAWTVWEVAPSTESGLGGIAQIENNIFSQKVRDMAENAFPIHK